MNLVKAFGIVLKELRVKKGLSQEGLALETGLDRTFISMLERGVRQPSITSLFELSKFLSITPSKLIERVEQVMKR